jgi:hypothetical protein
LSVSVAKIKEKLLLMLKIDNEVNKTNTFALFLGSKKVRFCLSKTFLDAS